LFHLNVRTDVNKNMRKFKLFILFFFLLNYSWAQKFRPPAVPLVTMDPYFSCWSFADHLYDENTKHWTGVKHDMRGIIRVDGKSLSFMGADTLPNVKQTSLIVNPTQTIYNFKCEGVDLKLTFTSPLLPNNLDLISRPVTYITFDIISNDNKEHETAIFIDVSGEWAINHPDQKVVWDRLSSPKLNMMRIGNINQDILHENGDDRRIDWGYLYFTPNIKDNASSYMGSNQAAIRKFIKSGTLPETDDYRKPRPANNEEPVLAVVYNLGKIKQSFVSKHLMIAYDEIYSIDYFDRKLKPWWKKKAESIEEVLEKADKEYDSLMMVCTNFDNDLIDHATKSGGEEYALLCALAYRQTIAAHKLVADSAGNPLFFSKENFSNGSIGTVDVTYPSSPLFLYYNSVLLKGMMDPIFYYSESGRWKKPFAAHDLGTYPIANGQTYPEDMPVEESGNMLILSAAIAIVENTSEYAAKHWKTLTIWAEYLRKEGFDPANQLSTDDFTGHLAHNANLSIKSILGLACYGMLAEKLGDSKTGKEYTDLAKDMAKKWMKAASDNDHYSLTFDKKGTWSQKYNLVWDKVLSLNIFPDEVRKKELAYYLKKQNQFGLPLDSRNTYTKSDWIMWTATLTDNKEDFKKFIHPIYAYVHQGPDRIPLCDWHETKSCRIVNFRARSVVGAYFMKMLDDKIKREKLTGRKL
jgi:hypothetical protein